MSDYAYAVGEIKKKLPSEDIVVFEFCSYQGKKFAAVYVDGLADKTLLGQLVVKPLKEADKSCGAEEIALMLASPEVKEGAKLSEGIDGVLQGDVVLFIEGSEKFFIIGIKNPPGRAVAEPPTQVTVKGPREGFTEDIKVNLALVRKRIKSKNFLVNIVQSGKRSKTSVAICYMDGICDGKIVKSLIKNIKDNIYDIIPDSSYIASFISARPKSLFKRCAMSEKPDIFCAKICEGRVGIIVDGSPIALTVPYMLNEEFQTVEDYYTTSYRATVIRFIRIFAVLLGIYMPSIYICAQLFKVQLIPVKLLFKIAGSVAAIPLSPSVEMFLTLFVLEILNEASIRMPKYVGLAMSVVGALVLGDTAVKAGIISTPAIIIVAFSAICLYTVPDFVETSTTLRLLFLIVAGSVGMFGVVTLTAFLLCYLTEQNVYGVPLMAPYAPIIAKDFKDSLYKANLFDLATRPKVFKSKNSVRYKKNGQ
jgi:spore germination protein KA